MFRTSSGSALDPNNILRDQLQPAFKRAGVECWAGWHAFRRGVATNLHGMGASDKDIQGVLRHSNVSVTQTCYIKTANQDSARAVSLLDEQASKLMDAVMFPVCALKSEKPGPLRLQ